MNTIARQNLLKVSGDTDYRILAHKHAKMLETADKYGSLPVVVAKTIVRAAMARRPKTRYATGGGAKIILFMKRLLPDRMFDWIMLRLMR